MRYKITELDKSTFFQGCVDYMYRLYIVDNDMNVLDVVTGVRSIGNYNIDGESDVRRTASFTLQLEESYRDESIENKIYTWIGYNFQLQIGMFNYRANDFLWYDCGYYAITQANTSYSAITNELTLSLSDWIVKLDGKKNGSIGGAPTIKIPVEDDEGNKTIIKHALIEFLKLSSIKSYIVDDIGEFYGLQENNEDWEEYRKKYPEWNTLPYDLEFDGSATVLDIVKELCKLYPNYQYYFDIYGNLCVTMIPSRENDPIMLDNEFFHQVLTADSAETVDYDLSQIKNVTEVFGKIYDIDRMSEVCSSSSNIYTVTLSDYKEYKTNEYIAFRVNTNNIENMKMRINSLGVIPIYLEDTTIYVDQDVMIAGELYVVKIKKVDGSYVAYFLGQYQPHAICVLTDNGNDEVYTKEYFSEKYNCDVKNIIMRVEDSPFSVQKLGEILDYKSGDEFENIESDSIARENALYYNRNATTFKDTVTINTKLIPFLDVHEKVSYKPKQEKEIKEYIIKSVNHNLDNYTSSITMYRFHPLYYL